MLDVEGVGELGQLIIREAAYRVCAKYRGVYAEKWERRAWAQRSLASCYEFAATMIVAFPRARFR